MVSNTLNKKVIIRGDKSGVFFGTLVAKEGTEVKLDGEEYIVVKQSDILAIVE